MLVRLCGVFQYQGIHYFVKLSLQFTLDNDFGSVKSTETTLFPMIIYFVYALQLYEARKEDR